MKSAAPRASFHKMSGLRITPIRLLKLFILLGLSSELPAVSKSARPGGSPPQGSWPSGSVAAWALPPADSKTGANETEARDEFKRTASNSSLGSLAEGSSISIVRSGIQSSEATNEPPAATTPADATSLKQTGPEPRQDVSNQAADTQTKSSTSPTGESLLAGNHRHHGAHSNHKNYPNEPYPSASYTALSLHHSPSSTLAGGLSAAPSSAPAAHSLLADREHHNLLLDTQADRLQHQQQQQTSLANQWLNGYANQQLQNPYQSAFGGTPIEQSEGQALAASMRNGLGDSYEDNGLNEALISLASAAAMPSVTFNDNNNQLFSNSNPSQLNASLIRNLTAGLFPVNKLSNVTMWSLGELLSRSKQAGNSLNNRPNEFDPFDYLADSSSSSAGGGANHQTTSGGYNLAASGHQANYLGALLSDSRLNSMLDLLAGKAGQTSKAASQFGFREPNAVSRYQTQAAGPLQRNNQLNASPFPQVVAGQMPTREANKFDSAQIVVGTRAHGPNQQLSRPSNVYNTYLPLKDNARGQTKPMTNGQVLNMAATLYDNYLDQNYRYPLVAKQQQQQQQQQHNVRDSAADYSTSSNQYQFIQHHNSAQNQHHLDKIVYHSTPFRPSIVSPPQQQQPMGGPLMNTTNGSQQANQQQSYQRPKSEADSKSMSYATLGANNQILGHMRPQTLDFGTNSSRAQQQQQQTKFEPMRQHENDLDSIYDHLNGPHSSHKHQTNQTSASSNNQQTQIGYNSTAGNKSGARVAPAAGALQQAPTSSGPQLLLDLYERAIDNQILEAIYSDHQQHFQHLGPSASAGSAPTLSLNQPQTSASMNSLSNWPFDDTIAPSFQTSEPSYSLTSGSRTPAASGPVALGHHQGEHYNSAALRGRVANPVLASSSISQPSSLLDPLASALQELPTFSASDLQPLLPPSEANSMLMAPTQVSHSSPPLNFNGQSPAATISDHTPDGSSLASLAAHLFSPLASSTAPAYNQLLGDHEMATSSYMFDSRLPSSSQLQVQQTIPASSSSNGNNQNNNNNNLGLPALLAKLQTGQFSSILASPFAHLYANLPRYRHTKSKQPAAAARPKHQNNFHPGSGSKLSKQQAAAAMAAATAANLIAASGHTLTPLQAAMIQAQAATSAYLNTEPLVAEHTNGHSSLLEAAAGTQPQQQLTLSQQVSNLASSSFAQGLAGGGVSPQVWRNILAPINWARKQSSSGHSSGAANSSSLASLQNSYGSQAASKGAKSPTIVGAYHQATGQPTIPLALMNTIWNSNSNNHLPFSHLLAASQTQLSSAPLVAAGSSTNEPQKRPASRLRIKILKIPVAFYDTSSASAGGELLGDSSQNGEASAPSISLMPVHLQPGPTASLLASLACPLHAHHPAAQMNPLFNGHSPASPMSGPTSIYPMALASGPSAHSHTAASNHQNAHRLNQFPYQYQSTDQMDPPFTGIRQSSAGERAGSLQNSASQTTSSTRAAAAPDKLAPIRDFTDINQPNDLQVSPSGATSNLSTILSQQQQQQAQFIQAKSS